MSDYFFPRGNGPLVSVICPTRGRPEQLIESMNSLWNRAWQTHHVEWLFKVDDDDEDSFNAVKNWTARCCGSGRDLCVKAPRGNGYADLHLWWTDLANRAKGDWLLTWSDDARMVTDKWDGLLAYMNVGRVKSWHGCPDVALLDVQSNGRLNTREFFFVRRKVIEILGHCSLHHHVDNWLGDVVAMCGSVFTTNIQVEHRQPRDDEAVRADALKAYKAAENFLNAPGTILAKCEDVAKLARYIEKWQEWRNEATTLLLP